MVQCGKLLIYIVFVFAVDNFMVIAHLLYSADHLAT
jgi:hypothetical protein